MSALRANLRLARRHPRYFTHLAIKKLQFARRFRWVRRHGHSDLAVPKPLAYKLMLNWGCNLRCPMCMLWGDVGWVKEDAKDTGKKELPWEVVEKVFASGLPWNSSFILSGGEPLMYSHFGPLLRKLREHQKFAIICTNGMWLDRFDDELAGNPFPTFLISLDGGEALNEELRGKNVYRKVIDNIEHLQRVRPAPFIGIQFTVMPENVHDMERFCEEMVERGVDWILLNPGWFVSDEQSRAYEAHMREHFGIEATTHHGYRRDYEYDKDAFEAALARIWSRNWPIQIASHLKEPEWVQDFIDRPDALLGNRLCYKQWLRVDVMPEGVVAPCAQFPDLSVGDLNEHEVADVWHGAANRRFQKHARAHSLPICAKCDAIYLYGGRGHPDGVPTGDVEGPRESPARGKASGPSGSAERPETTTANLRSD